MTGFPLDAAISRRRLFGLGAGVAAAVAGGAALDACGSPDTSAEVRRRHRDGILQVGLVAAPDDLNPLDSGSEITRWIADPVMESLYAWDDQLRSVPLLADGDPEISPDGLTWTIRLKRGIRFHNGDELGADDLVATWSRMLDLSAGSEWITYMLGYVQRFSAVDDHTAQMVLAHPYGLLRSHLTNMPVSHRDYVDRRDTMMGTGPYRLAASVPGQSFTLSRFDGYHGRRPAFSAIQFTVFADTTTRLVTLEQGKVDLITGLAYGDLAQARRSPGVAVQVAKAPMDVLTYVNLFTEPFSDRNFRKAVAYATDRRGVLDRVYGGQATIGQGPIGPAELGYDAGLQVFPAAPDYATARSYLAKATTTRRTFTVTIGQERLIADICQVLAAGWAELGITVHLQPLAAGPWSNEWLSRKYEMLAETFQSGFTSGPANYLVLTPADETSILSCGYKNPDVTRLMATVWQTADDQERVDALRRIDRIVADDAVMFPPVYPKLAIARRTELSAPDPRQLRISRLGLQNLHFVG